MNTENINAAKELPKVWTATEEWGKPLSSPPDYTIKLNKHDKAMGCLDFNGDKLKFEGDVEESARIFFDFLLSSFNQRIEEIKEEAEAKNAMLLTVAAVERKRVVRAWDEIAKLQAEVERLRNALAYWDYGTRAKREQSRAEKAENECRCNNPSIITASHNGKTYEQCSKCGKKFGITMDEWYEGFSKIESTEPKDEVSKLKAMVMDAAKRGDMMAAHWKERAEKAEALVKQIHHYAGIIEGFQNPITK